MKNKKIKALEMYKKGYTLREIAKVLGYSHEWVRVSIKEIENDIT